MKQTVVRYHEFSEYRQSKSFFHSQVLLFVPWKREETDILQDYETYLYSYNASKDTIEQNKAYIEKYETLINEAPENADDEPVSAWNTIAPQTQQELYDCQDKVTEINPEYQILQPEQNMAQDSIRLSEPTGNATIGMTIETQPTILPFSDYCLHMQS